MTAQYFHLCCTDRATIVSKNNRLEARSRQKKPVFFKKTGF
ncbi:hypothetical protein [Coleofasciculus sp. FACHB-SPT9]